MLKFKNVITESANVNTVNYFFKRFVSKVNHNILYKNKYEGDIKNEKEIKIKHMNSSVLCIFSNMLLKENIKNDFIWKKIEKRSYELIDKFEVGEIASFLFCLSKIRYETNLYDSFIPIIKKKCEYFNTSNLAMLISTYSKRKKENLIIFLKEELKKKVHTLYNIVEISMILNALVKCKINDEDLFVKLSSIIMDNIMHSHVHVRDICVITYCFACILYKNMNIFKTLSQKIILLMDDINLMDLCRILYSYMKINKNFNHILKICTYKLTTVMDKSSIDDVINCIHFLPNIKEIIENYELIYGKGEYVKDDKNFNYSINYINLFNYIINIFNEKLISYVNLLNCNQISNLFYIYSRYNILICLSKMDIFISQIKKMKLLKELKIYVLYSLSILLKNYENNNMYDFHLLDVNKIFIKENTEKCKTEKCKKDNVNKCLNACEYENLKNNLLRLLNHWEDDIEMFINNYDICLIQDIIKVLNILLILNYTHNSIIHNIKNYIIINYKNINEHSAYTLLFYFQKLNIINDGEDLTEILKCKMKQLKHKQATAQ
ncbi:conserved Plasmodium protein, unknown function [Plasmodium malariae]|uniref:RNA-editing substrate-binding complex 6 protein domain-containing protein n=1 Tax=Plasmodium malariae TaxID=5858 RepID=A0A1A8VV86_PLAMA|nr:conserved Plasmodium protein, unknown function [Plasmodium malariae]SBS84404.1 conserved Plasmodium protein, unknown function [Plasmodium malariae]SCN12151.1 conserved Plasmodium protein, unknown function [Plasmodium malariae]